MKTNRKRAVKLVRQYRIGYAVKWQWNNEHSELINFLIDLFDITEDELLYRGKPTTTRKPVSYWPAKPMSTKEQSEWEGFFNNIK